MSLKANNLASDPKTSVCASEDSKEIRSLLGKRKHMESLDESHTAHDESEEGSKDIKKEKR